MNISFTDVQTPRFVSSTNDAIGMLVKFTHMDEVVEFVAREDDIEKHGQELYRRALSGEFGPVGEYVEPVMDTAQTAAAFKAQITNKIEDKAVELGFESLAEALTYCDEPAVPLYQQQALALRKWRSLVWAWYDSVMASDSFIEASSLDELPKFEMPA